MTDPRKLPADGGLMAALLDSLKVPVLFADPKHVVRYLNKAAIDFYDQGAALLGTDLLDCHNAESQVMMKDILQAMQQGEEERLITDDEKHRIYMRAVRDRDGSLLGYYERYEPPVTMAAGQTE